MKNYQKIILASVLITCPFTTKSQNSDPLYERTKPVMEYLMKSDILSEDIKFSCRLYPENLFQISVALIDVVFIATTRPDNELVAQVISRVKQNQLTPQDFLVLRFFIGAYGEATIVDGKMIELYHEPTHRDSTRIIDMYLDPLTNRLKHKETFISSLRSIRNVICDLGQRMAWNQTKINEEIEGLNKCLALYLSTISHGGITVYSSAFYEMKNKELATDIERLKEQIAAGSQNNENICNQINKKKNAIVSLKQECESLIS